MFNWFKKIKARINVEEDSQELSPRAKPPTPKEAFHKWITKKPINPQNRKK